MYDFSEKHEYCVEKEWYRLETLPVTALGSIVTIFIKNLAAHTGVFFD